MGICEPHAMRCSYLEGFFFSVPSFLSWRESLPISYTYAKHKLDSGKFGILPRKYVFCFVLFVCFFSFCLFSSFFFY